MSQASTIKMPSGRGRGRPPNKANDQKILKKRHHHQEEEKQMLISSKDSGCVRYEEELGKRFKVDPDATL